MPVVSHVAAGFGEFGEFGELMVQAFNAKKRVCCWKTDNVISGCLNTGT